MILAGLEASRKQPDGKLHPSSHLVGSLRHAQLELAGAPMLPRDTAEEFKLLIGTLIHKWIAEQGLAQGMALMSEVKITPWLPDGWAGTPDGFYWLDDYKAFALADYKTMKPEGIPWVLRDGVKETHQWQTSMYYHAAVDRGFPMVKRIVVAYLPKDQSTRQDQHVDVTLVDFEPLPKDLVWGEAKRRLERLTEYLAAMRDHPDWPEESCLLNDALEPVQDRVPKLVWDKARCVWNVNLVPHWSAAYCPFSDELCGCRSQGQTKVGHWWVDDDNTMKYTPRQGEDGALEPLVTPEESEWNRRKVEIERHKRAAEGNADAGL